MKQWLKENWGALLLWGLIIGGVWYFSRTDNSGPISGNNSNYICSSDIYNCSDFATHNEAQKALETCGGRSNDVHKLDRDNDGLACELN